MKSTLLHYFSTKLQNTRFSKGSHRLGKRTGPLLIFPSSPSLSSFTDKCNIFSKLLDQRGFISAARQTRGISETVEAGTRSVFEPSSLISFWEGGWQHFLPAYSDVPQFLNNLSGIFYSARRIWFGAYQIE